MPPTQPKPSPAASRVGFVGMTPPRPGPQGYTHGIPSVMQVHVEIPPMLPASPPKWRPRRRR